jgi:hypothetical protein
VRWTISRIQRAGKSDRGCRSWYPIPEVSVSHRNRFHGMMSIDRPKDSSKTNVTQIGGILRLSDESSPSGWSCCRLMIRSMAASPHEGQVHPNHEQMHVPRLRSLRSPLRRVVSPWTSS